MPDLIIHIPGHGFEISDYVNVSWLRANFYVRDPDNDPSVATDSFKISYDDSDDNIVPFTETITEGSIGPPSGASGIPFTDITMLESWGF
jgi:hypothetical protein